MKNLFKIIGKRLILLIPVLIGISILVFTIMDMAPGDAAQNILGQNASQEEVAELREELGLNRPFLTRYFDYMKGVLSGNLGTSWSTHLPVLDEIAARLPTTIGLTIGSTLIMVIIGVPVGIISAVKKYSVIDCIFLVLAFIMTAMPSFWIGLILMLTLGLKLHWFPTIGAETWKHFVLPCIALSSVQMAAIIRMTRSTMLEVMNQDYIRTARAKGASEGRIVFRHALRNTMMPVTTLIGLRIGSCMGGTLIIESVFGMPGFGSLIINAVRIKNVPVVMGGILYIAIVIGIVNLAIDIIYTFIDPRVRV